MGDGLCSRCGAPRSPALVGVRWPAVIGVYAVGLLIAYALGGGLLHDFIEGLRRDRLPLWKGVLMAAALTAAAVAAVTRWRQTACARCGIATPAWLVCVRGDDGPLRLDPSRRLFLRAGVAAGAVLTALGTGVLAAVVRNRGWVPVVKDFFLTPVEHTSAQPRPEWREARIRSYRRLGRTNVLVSDISLGSANIRDVAVARRALDGGVNYFDTSPDYAATGSERVLGEAMKGRRDQVFVATKFCGAHGHLLPDTPVSQIIAAVEDSLRRLDTDYIDLIHIHSCDRLERLLAPSFHEAFDRLKEQGKARFLGVSSHAPNLEPVATAAIDSGRFDVLMLAYHFGMWNNFGAILDRAAANGVGVVAMKTLKGAKHTKLAAFHDETASYSHAAFRWVLANPAVSCLVVSMSTPQQVEEYLAASGSAPRPADTALLERYDRLTAGDYCQPHCGACLDACPQGLPINDVLRYRMYARDYGWDDEGARLYARLQRNAALCADCAAPCAHRCPIEVPIRDKMLDAHGALHRAG